MENKNIKFNMTVAPLWSTKTDGYLSITLDGEHIKALKDIHKGGKFFIKPLPPERRKGQNSPHAYLEFIPAEKVEANFKKRDNGDGSDEI